jgi:hypothetical protein
VTTYGDGLVATKYNICTYTSLLIKTELIDAPPHKYTHIHNERKAKIKHGKNFHCR